MPNAPEWQILSPPCQGEQNTHTARSRKRMAIRIKSRGGESVEQMMRRFKKLCEKEGLTKDVKRKQFFEKPSERRRRAARKTSSPKRSFSS